MGRAGRPPQDPARRLERAHRILDAATELILKWGYDKTTIDDVAQRAGVAKGTIYLHWKTRDELFTALLRRERVHTVAELREREPECGFTTPGELFGRFALTLLGRPLMRAMLRGDSEVLGKLARRKRESGPQLPLGGPLDAYVEELAAIGAVHGEPRDQVIVISSIVYGFLFLPDVRPEDAKLPDERIAELVATTIDRALGIGEPLPPGGEQVVALATRRLLDGMAEAAQRKLALSLEA
ncbi:TetR/AcrR family transcriptional regulator [Nonomuraea fastidiosa]|uniref:TetR/AcrR family transcriptional regulator n=1 Tax=Nonomuraea fastidiosa TaxID=46173 RepID=UPI0036722258